MSESPEAYIHLKPKARKSHRCCECRGLISPGERYHKVTGIWDGTPDTFKTCEDCTVLRAEADAGLPYYDLTPFGYLHETLIEIRDRSLLMRFVEVQRNRGVDISPKVHTGIDE